MPFSKKCFLLFNYSMLENTFEKLGGGNGCDILNVCLTTSAQVLTTKQKRAARPVFKLEQVALYWVDR